MEDAIRERLCSYSEMTDVVLEKYLPSVNCLQKDVLDTARQALNENSGRIRAALALEFCRVCGEDPETALPAACAAEMVYAFSVLHGRLIAGGSDCNMLLAGDALLMMSAEIIAKAVHKGRLSGTSAFKITEMLCGNAGVFGLTGGMALGANGGELAAGVILEKYRMQSGALFEFCCRAGCVAAEAGITKQTSAGAFGQRLGLALAILKDVAEALAGGCKSLSYAAAVGADKARLEAQRLVSEAEKCLADFEDNFYLIGIARALSEECGLISPEEIG